MAGSGGVALGEGPAGMRDRVEHPGGPGVQRRGRVAELVQRGALAIAQVPVAGPQPRPEPHPVPGQAGDHVDQVAQRPAQAVQPPDHQRVAVAQLFQRPAQLGTVLRDPGDAVGEHPPAPGRGQRVVLQGGVLLQRRHPGIPDQLAHASTVAVPVPGRARDTLKVERECENPRPGQTPFKINVPGSCQKRPLPVVAAGQR